MGSCVSKCHLSPSSPVHPNPPQDKLVISQTCSHPSSHPSSSTSSSGFESSTNSHSSSSSSSLTSSSIQDPQKTKTTEKTRTLPAKRERSSSPPAGQKSFRKAAELRRPTQPLRPAPNSPSPARVVELVHLSSREKKDGVMKMPRPTHPFNGSRRLGRGSSMRRAQLVHPEQEQGKVGRMEEMDNPLIFMECFIFV